MVMGATVGVNLIVYSEQNNPVDAQMHCQIDRSSGGGSLNCQRVWLSSEPRLRVRVKPHNARVLDAARRRGNAPVIAG